MLQNDTNTVSYAINVAQDRVSLQPVCYQSAIEWGEAGNYMQSVSDNAEYNYHKPLKIFVVVYIDRNSHLVEIDINYYSAFGLSKHQIL